MSGLLCQKVLLALRQSVFYDLVQAVQDPYINAELSKAEGEYGALLADGRRGETLEKLGNISTYRANDILHYILSKSLAGNVAIPTDNIRFNDGATIRVIWFR